MRKVSIKSHHPVRRGRSIPTPASSRVNTPSTCKTYSPKSSYSVYRTSLESLHLSTKLSFITIMISLIRLQWGLLRETLHVKGRYSESLTKTNTFLHRYALKLSLFWSRTFKRPNWSKMKRPISISSVTIYSKVIRQTFLLSLILTQRSLMPKALSHKIVQTFKRSPWTSNTKVRRILMTASLQLLHSSPPRSDFRRTTVFSRSSSL